MIVWHLSLEIGQGGVVGCVTPTHDGTVVAVGPPVCVCVYVHLCFCVLIARTLIYFRSSRYCRAVLVWATYMGAWWSTIDMFFFRVFPLTAGGGGDGDPKAYRRTCRRVLVLLLFFVCLSQNHIILIIIALNWYIII